MRKIIASAALASLVACSQNNTPEAVPEADPATQRTTATGDVVGFVEANGAHVWRGVPFAADTSGKNRWRAPRPAEAWEGIREAVEFSPTCPQIATPFSGTIEGFDDGELEGNEDCLKLDIYAPADAQGQSLPVMVWIHGGSNVSGASQLYRGHNLAVNENVIVVSIQYRLGPLGFFSHPALIESAAQERDKAANFAVLDAIAALEWVQANASAFGGNPDNVTIFGESAGGHDVAALLISPLAEGLYHRAIIQSGLVDSLTPAEARGEEGDQPNPSFAVTERLGGPERFHTATLAEVFDAYELEDGMWMELPRMIEDGVSIPAMPMAEAFAGGAPIADVPTITGTNRDEMKLFYAFDDRLTKPVFSIFRKPIDEDFYNSVSHYAGRAWRVRSVDGVASALGAQGRTDVWAYRFDWDEGGTFLFTDFSKLLGAAHAIEIPFVFNRISLIGQGDQYLFSKKTEASRQELSQAMGAHWAAFARTGNPDLAGQAWSTFGTEGSSIIFDTQADGGIRNEVTADSFAAIAADLQTDETLTDEQQCLIAGALLFWSEEVAANMDCPSVEKP